MQQISGAFNHNIRQTETLNANENVKNYVLDDAYQGEYLMEYKRKLGDHQPRKNAVRGIEVLCSASPDFFNGHNINGWAQTTRKWIEKNMGGKENVVQMTLHMDEKTPHIHAVIIPMKNKKLNATNYIGGHRDRLVELQDSYHASVQNLGLKRGLKNTKAHHLDIKKWYTKETERQEELESLENRIYNQLAQKNLLGKQKINHDDAIQYVIKSQNILDEARKENKKLKEDNKKLSEKVDGYSTEKFRNTQKLGDFDLEIRKLNKEKRAIERELTKQGIDYAKFVKQAKLNLNQNLNRNEHKDRGMSL